MSLRHTLLAIIDWIPLHGYALREAAKGYSWLHPMTNANIYPTLRKLEQAGLIQHREDIVDGRLRKVYDTTEAGQAEIRHWLSNPTDDAGVFRDPHLLKICLMRDAAREPARKWLEEDLARCREGLEDSEKVINDSAGMLPKYTALVSEHGLELLRLRISFLEQILAEFSEASAEPPNPEMGRDGSLHTAQLGEAVEPPGRRPSLRPGD